MVLDRPGDHEAQHQTSHWGRQSLGVRRKGCGKLGYRNRGAGDYGEWGIGGIVDWCYGRGVQGAMAMLQLVEGHAMSGTGAVAC